MAINKRSIIGVFLVFIVSNLAFIPMASSNGLNSIQPFKENTIEPEPGDLELPDKVYTFVPPSDTLLFDDIYLIHEYIYWVYVEIVTPSECHIEITAWDTDNDVFHLLEEDIFFEPEYGRYVEVPFGAAESGRHNFEIYVEAAVPVNLYVRIEQGPKCLNDKMSNTEINGIITREVVQFHNGMDIDQDISLKTDYSYKIYLGRVNGISEERSNDVRVDFSIKDPDELEFPIFSDDPMAGPDEVNWSFFGTSQEGIYELNIKVYCDEPYVNVAYALIDNSQISEIQDVNDTSAPDKEDDEVSIFEEFSGGAGSVPAEFITGAVIVAAIGIGSLVIAFVFHKRDPRRRLDLNE